jgi:hypothetical protein
VVLPDYQGIGAGKRMLNFIADLYTSQTKMTFIILASPPNNQMKPKEVGDCYLWMEMQAFKYHLAKQTV